MLCLRCLAHNNLLQAEVDNIETRHMPLDGASQQCISSGHASWRRIVSVRHNCCKGMLFPWQPHMPCHGALRLVGLHITGISPLAMPLGDCVCWLATCGFEVKWAVFN